MGHTKNSDYVGNWHRSEVFVGDNNPLAVTGLPSLLAS